ncbi:hypothetical protein HanPI659440_Chr09g0328211 [Helianthus annuus]|nr:hypothetical protein HanPI659440_Chr09g0328211 [Helianthus annuus]
MSVEGEGSSAPKRQKPNVQRKKTTREHGEGRLRLRINVHTGKAQNANKRKALSQNVEVEEEPYHEFSGARVLSRVKPTNLTGWFINLNQNQRKAVEQIGFGATLKLKIDTVPTMLGYWLVENYNEKTNTLNVGNHTVHMNEESIYSLTGIPNGRVPVNMTKRPTTKDQVVAAWKAQFEGFDWVNRPSVKLYFDDILPLIHGCRRDFCLNFLVAFFTIMGHASDNAVVTPQPMAESSGFGMMRIGCSGESITTNLVTIFKRWVSRLPKPIPAVSINLLHTLK